MRHWPQFVEQIDITENSLFFGKKLYRHLEKSMRFKSGDPLDHDYYSIWFNLTAV
jgi:hypothetical protein